MASWRRCPLHIGSALRQPLLSNARKLLDSPSTLLTEVSARPAVVVDTRGSKPDEDGSDEEHRRAHCGEYWEWFAEDHKAAWAGKEGLRVL